MGYRCKSPQVYEGYWSNPRGQLITEESDEQFPVGHYLSTRFWRPLLESFYKKTQKGEDNDAITQTLSTAFGQQLKGGRKAIANKQGHGSTHLRLLLTISREQKSIPTLHKEQYRFGRSSKGTSTPSMKRTLFLGNKASYERPVRS